MKLRLINEENQIQSSWSGGKTRELAIFPEDSSYLERDFIWRLSTAASQQEESSFTRFEGFERILMLIEGDIVLSHGQKRSVHLKAMEQDAFDGGIKTRCFGKLERDYNLIMAKGCRGALSCYELSNDAVDIRETLEGEVKTSDSEYRSYGVYCLDGYVVINCDDRSKMIRPKNQAIIDLGPGEDEKIGIMGEGSCIIATVAFEAGKTEVEKPSAEDPEKPGYRSGGRSFGANYGTCLKLFAKSNKWSKMMRREGVDSDYYDKELSKALAKIERKYLTALIWACGCIICFIPTAAGHGAGISVGLALAYTILHIFLVAPLIYWIVLPKPVGAHIKSIDDMNVLEKLHHEEEIASDPHFERVMSKYTSDRDNYFTDEKSVFYRLVNKKK